MSAGRVEAKKQPVRLSPFESQMTQKEFVLRYDELSTDSVIPSNTQVLAEHAKEKEKAAETKAKTDLPRSDENLSDANEEDETVRFY